MKSSLAIHSAQLSISKILLVPTGLGRMLNLYGIIKQKRTPNVYKVCCRDEFGGCTQRKLGVSRTVTARKNGWEISSTCECWSKAMVKMPTLIMDAVLCILQIFRGFHTGRTALQFFVYRMRLSCGHSRVCPWFCQPRAWMYCTNM